MSEVVGQGAESFDETVSLAFTAAVGPKMYEDSGGKRTWRTPREP